MIVCLCRGVSETTIRRCIDAGASTPQQLAEMCGAGAECGACDATLNELILGVRSHRGCRMESPYLLAPRGPR